jgi:hypothetical protein
MRQPSPFPGMMNVMLNSFLSILAMTCAVNAFASSQPVKPSATKLAAAAASSSPSASPNAKDAAVNVAAAKGAADDLKKMTLLEIDGKIYPRDDFPESCRTLLKGSGCAVDPYGKYHVEAKKEGDLVYSKAVFSDHDGIQVTEESWEKDGHVQRAVVDSKVLGKKSELEVKNGKVLYKTTEKDGTVKTSEDDADDNLVVASTVMSYIRPMFKSLNEGKEIKIRVAVLDRQEAFTFAIKKDHEDKGTDGAEIMVLKMAPTSLIIKAVVDPLYFYVHPKTGEMFAFEGRSALRKKDGDSYKEMSVRSAYTYRVNAWNEFEKNSASKSTGASCDPLSEINAGAPAKCEIKE